MGEPVFLVALAIAASTVVLVARTIAGAVSGRGGSRSELDQLKDRLDQHSAALEEAESTLASQSTQLAELQERLDFAERLLSKGGDRTALGPGDHRG
jgi:hypothetical protein